MNSNYVGDMRGWKREVVDVIMIEEKMMPKREFNGLFVMEICICDVCDFP